MIEQGQLDNYNAQQPHLSQHYKFMSENKNLSERRKFGECSAAASEPEKKVQFMVVKYLDHEACLDAHYTNAVLIMVGGQANNTDM